MKTKTKTKTNKKKIAIFKFILFSSAKLPCATCGGFSQITSHIILSTLSKHQIYSVFEAKKYWTLWHGRILLYHPPANCVN